MGNLDTAFISGFDCIKHCIRYDNRCTILSHVGCSLVTSGPYYVNIGPIIPSEAVNSTTKKHSPPTHCSYFDTSEVLVCVGMWTHPVPACCYTQHYTVSNKHSICQINQITSMQLSPSLLLSLSLH